MQGAAALSGDIGTGRYSQKLLALNIQAGMNCLAEVIGDLAHWFGIVSAMGRMIALSYAPFLPDSTGVSCVTRPASEGPISPG